MDLTALALKHGIEPRALWKFAMREAQHYPLSVENRTALDLWKEWPEGLVDDLLWKWSFTQPTLRETAKTPEQKAMDRQLDIFLENKRKEERRAEIDQATKWLERLRAEEVRNREVESAGRRFDLNL